MAAALMHSLRTNSINLAAIVTDLNLPFFDGFEILAAVRAHARYRKVPIVVITGDGRSGIAQRAQELGARRFLFQTVFARRSMSRTGGADRCLVSSGY